MTLRNCFSASSIPAAVQRRPISPEDQCLTLRWVRADGVDHRLARVRGLERAPELALDPEPDHGQRLLHALAQRAGGAGVGVLELVGERW